MKGLLIKDYQLLKENTTLLLVVILIGSIFVITQGSDSAYFLVSFVTLIVSMLVVTTISYDDFDHGNAFLMTLPITRSVYVREKYLLGIVMSAGGWLLSSAVATIIAMQGSAAMNWTEWLLTLSMFLMIAVLLVSVMIPVQLKFGGDKGRIAMIGCVLGAMLIGIGVIQAMEYLHLDYMALLDSLFALSMVWLMTIVLVILVVCMSISYLISLKVMLRKQL